VIDEVRPALLAVGEQVQPHALLLVEDRNRGIVLRLAEKLAFEAKRYFAPLAIRKPIRPRKASDGRGCNGRQVHEIKNPLYSSD
jgi:hypothetical protein